MNDNKPVILVVDDFVDNIILMRNILKNEYQVKVSTNGEMALEVAELLHPDLILMDIMMPVMDGYKTCEKLKADSELKDIPIIFITAKCEEEDESKGFDLGAVDYITKPISPAILLSRVRTHIALKNAQDMLKDRNDNLENEIKKRTKEINSLQELSIMAMATLAEIRDNETGLHIQRTKLYLKELAENMSTINKYKDMLTPETIELIVASAPLHDIGKVGIPDSILLKADKLTEEEFEMMKRHTLMGNEALKKAEKQIGKDETFLKYAKEIALYHHERWNGKGYMYGLAGEDIPLSARIMAVADVMMH